jgi:hypothetical protein
MQCLRFILTRTEIEKFMQAFTHGRNVETNSKTETEQQGLKLKRKVCKDHPSCKEHSNS